MSVRELFPDFLKPNNSQGPALPGELFWVPTAEVDFTVIETRRATATAHTQVQFQLAAYEPARHYREKEHLPVKLLHLDERSEALMFRSKKRPCLVLGSAHVTDHNTLSSVSDQRQAQQLSNIIYLVAPAYSANSPADPRGPFPPEMLLRIEKLHYPHLAWMPALDGQGPGSVLRLDRIFAVSSALLTVDARCRYKASRDAFEIIQAQMAEVLGIPRSEALEVTFRETKEIVAIE
jgi:hypothetical protein